MQNDRLIRLCDALMRLRPTQLGAMLKVILGLRRRVLEGPDGALFFADPASLFGLELLKTASYEPDMTRLIDSTLRPGDTFIDLGANEGYFSILAAKRIGDGRVIAIEPQSRLQGVLAENQRLNGLHNITVCQGAIADREGRACLALRPSTHSGASSMFPYWRIGWREETVRTLSLDRLFQEQGIEGADLMKVDCEGAEKLVFAGRVEILRKHGIRVIILEYHPQIIGARACESINQSLRTLGYRAKRWRGLNIYLAPSVPDEVLPGGAVAFESLA